MPSSEIAKWLPREPIQGVLNRSCVLLFGKQIPVRDTPNTRIEANKDQLLAAASFSENPIRPASSGIPMSKTGTIRFIFAKTIEQLIT